MKKKIVVIGCGPAGYTAALQGAQAGMDVILVEKGAFGGVCVNYGCIPTKSYLKFIKVREQFSPAQFSSDDFIQQMKAAQEETVNHLSYGIRFLMERAGVRMIEGRASIGREGQVLIEKRSQIQEAIKGDAVILATGSKEKELGLDKDCQLHPLQELIQLENLPKEISIMGGSILGVELAVILQAAGVETHLIEKEALLLPTWDEEIGKQMKIYLESRGINIKTSCDEPACRDVAVCCGRDSILPDLADEVRVQLNVENGILAVDENCSVGPDWLYGIGDCVSRYKEANTAMEQGKKVIEQIAGKTKSAGAFDFPPAKCIYTPLEAATAGKTKANLDAVGIPCIETFYPITQTAAGMLNGLEQGFIKVVMELDSHILAGFHLMASFASELIMTCQMAVECRMTAEAFTSFIFPHPTECELLKEAVCQLLRNRE